MTLQEIDTYTSIASHLTIIIAIAALAHQVWQNRKSNRMALKDRFSACTAKYMKIQELFLSNDKLDRLNVKIYQRKLSGQMGSDANALAKELALAGLMFQLMEDVWLIHDLDKHQDERLYSGWDNLFFDWMNTQEIRDKWDVLKMHFSQGFIEYIEDRYKENIKASAASAGVERA